MVDALKKIHRLLKPGGRLIDIHPHEDPRPIEVRVGQQHMLAGWLRETDDYIEYVQADEALEQVVAQGWFTCEEHRSFSFRYHADTIERLRDYLEENSSDAIIDDAVIVRANDLSRSIETDTEVIMWVPVEISRWRRLTPPG